MVAMVQLFPPDSGAWKQFKAPGRFDAIAYDQIYFQYVANYYFAWMPFGMPCAHNGGEGDHREPG
jgi:hypothetical protein